MTMTRFLIAVALMPVAYALGIVLAAMLMVGGEGGSEQVPAPIAAIPAAPTPIKAVPPPAWVVPPPAQVPRIMPPWPAPLGGPWKETPKEECELLPDREEARLCVQYPGREAILNSLVLRLDSVRPNVARYKPERYKVPQSCPIIPTDEARALVCGYLAEQYDLYCCQ